MKTLIILITILTSFSGILGSTFSIAFDDSIKTVLLADLPKEKEIIFTHTITNKTSETLKVKIINSDLKLPEKWLTYFCTLFCFPATTDTIELEVDANSEQIFYHHIFVGNEVIDYAKVKLLIVNTVDESELLARESYASTGAIVKILNFNKSEFIKGSYFLTNENGYFNLDFYSNFNQIISFSMYTPKGVKLFSLIENIVGSGKQKLSFPILKIAAGTYITSLTLNNSHFTRKINLTSINK